MGQTTGQGSIGLSQKPSGSAGGVTDLENGLYKDGTIGKMGGALVENTTIDGTGFEFKLVADEGTFFYANLQNGSADPYAVIMGDISNLVSGLKLGVFSGDNYIAALDESANFLFIIDPANLRYGLGDISFSDNGTYLLIDDENEEIEISNVGAGAINNDFLVLNGDDRIKKIPSPVESGTYTPTVTTGSNVTAGTPGVCLYTRTGNIVTVSGMVEITETTNALSFFTLSLPIASTFALGGQCAGTYSGYIQAVSTLVPGLIAFSGNEASFQHECPNAAGGTTEYYFHFHYLITNP